MEEKQIENIEIRMDNYMIDKCMEGKHVENISILTHKYMIHRLRWRQLFCFLAFFVGPLFLLRAIVVGWCVSRLLPLWKWRCRYVSENRCRAATRLVPTGYEPRPLVYHCTSVGTSYAIRRWGSHLPLHRTDQHDNIWNRRRATMILRSNR